MPRAKPKNQKQNRMPEQWWWISGPRWTFGIAARRGIVVEAAPISKWALGKPVERVLAWWRSKGADDVRELG